MNNGFEFPHAEFIDPSKKRIGLIFPFGDKLGLDKDHLPKTEAEIRRYVQKNHLDENGYLEFCMDNVFPLDCSGIAFLLDLELQLEERNHSTDKRIILCNPGEIKKTRLNFYRVTNSFSYQSPCSESCPFYRLAHKIKSSQKSTSITNPRQCRFSTS